MGSFLQYYSDRSAYYATPSQILSSESINENDLIILVSQGWSKSEALLVTKKAIESQAKLIVVTGNPQNSQKYSYPIETLTVFPQKEDLFCRPASLATCYALLSQISAKITNYKFDSSKMISAWNQGLETSVSNLRDYEEIFVLGSGLSMASTYAITVFLREGMGIHADIHEIESYGHGWYISDQADIQQKSKKALYIVVNNKGDMKLQSPIERILPLLKDSNSEYEVWETDDKPLYGNMKLIARMANTVYELNKLIDYDINNPPGTKEIKPFHSIEVNIN
jgi:hypothetical protein